MNPTPTPDSPSPQPVDIARLRELLAKATPGPWKYVDEYADEPENCINKEGEQFYCMVAKCVIDDENGDSPQEIADAQLIAALRNDAPALLDELERLRVRETINEKQLDDVQNALNSLLAECDKLREEVKELSLDAMYIADQFREIGVNPAHHNTGEKAAEQVVSLFKRIESERDSLRRENAELRAKLK